MSKLTQTTGIRSDQFASVAYWVFLTCISLIGVGMALYATVPYGAGVSGDAARNLSTAESLLQGRGFFDHGGTPFVFWPPLYPVMLAGLGLFAKGDVFPGGWYLNVALLGLNIFLSGMLLRSLFPARPTFQIIGTLFILLSPSSVAIHTNIASDPLYIAFSLLFLMAASQYLTSQSRRALAAMVVLSALASLQRLLGLSLIVTGSCLILYQNWNNWRKMIGEGAAFGILSTLPLGAWIFFHNFMRYHTFRGEFGVVFPWENLNLSLLKMMRWFIPYERIPTLVIHNPWTPVVAALILLALINRRKNWISWREYILSRRVFPVILFLPLSIVGLVYSVATVDHKGIESDRYYIGLFVPVLAWLFSTWEHLIRPHLGANPKIWDKTLLILMLVWSVYPIHRTQEFLENSRAMEGVAVYNVYNTLAFRNSETLGYVRNLLAEDNRINLYSNFPSSIWFSTRHPAELLPWLDKHTPFDKTIASQLAGWPGDRPGYVIWLEPDVLAVTLTPEEISLIADTRLVYRGSDGEIYYVKAKNK